MRNIKFLTLILNILSLTSLGQNNFAWPKATTSNGITIKIYLPEIESLRGDDLKARAAISVLEKDKPDPLFGAIWMTAILQSDRETRTAEMIQIKINDIRFSAGNDTAKIQILKRYLENEMPKWDLKISLDQLEASLQSNDSTIISSNNLATTPPKIFYSSKPSTLVLIDGEPKLKENKEAGIDLVMNTAFTIANNKGMYYLYGSYRWYSSKDILGPWKYIKNIPKSLDKLDMAIKESEKKEDKAAKDSASAIVPEILISTEAAELIQTNGEANLSPIPGTNLLYVTNTNNDLFLNISDQQYFVLLSGRWYQSASLKGNWAYIASDKLPVDFVKIPEKSAKENVLASVAGTYQAQDAIMDAQIPQTAKVDRKTATTKVTYEGEPKFKAIEGTGLQYALNTNSTVLLSGDIYYCVDGGIWFASKSPKGPWAVSDNRPSEVEKIPASEPVYNVKYVYVYEVTPQYVYVGYTPGYTGCYIYHGTVVYGTGFYYNPWYGPFYYPRPVTYGFSVHYNPWNGWSMGFHYSAGWFNMSIYGGGYRGGYWGPPMYRPPYYRPPYYGGGYRPPYYPAGGYRPPPQVGHYNRPVNNPGINDNMYRNNKGVSTSDKVRSMPASRPTNQGPANTPSAGSPHNKLPGSRPSLSNNNITTDKRGNIFQKNGNDWQQRNGNNWQNVDRSRQSDINNLNRQQNSIDRGNQRTNNFNQSRQTAPIQRPAPSGGARGRK